MVFLYSSESNSHQRPSRQFPSAPSDTSVSRWPTSFDAPRLPECVHRRHPNNTDRCRVRGDRLTPLVTVPTQKQGQPKVNFTCANCVQVQIVAQFHQCFSRRRNDPGADRQFRVPLAICDGNRSRSTPVNSPLFTWFGRSAVLPFVAAEVWSAN